MCNSTGKIQEAERNGGTGIVGADHLAGSLSLAVAVPSSVVAPDEGGGTGDGTLGVKGALLLGTS